MRMILSAAILLSMVGVAAAANPGMIGETSKGKTLTDAKGMTLYVFDKDATDKSNCNGPCAILWPVLMADADDKPTMNWTIVTRDDGSKQWAYKTKPVYTYSKDTNASDVTGDGFNGVWHIATP
jgi:predicted lipoprotein with Yx(FWY)xxD motif